MSQGILAIDWGLRKVGLAKSDDKGIVISPRPVWMRSPAGQTWSLTAEDKTKFKQILEQEDLMLLLLGDPRGPSGESTPASENAHRFATKLELLSGLPVALIPEQNSSWEHEGEDNEDSLVAASFLQSFFEDPTLAPLKDKFLKKEK